MLGVDAALAQVAITEVPFYGSVAPPSKPVVGWFPAWDKPRKRITLEQLQAILAEQGSPWAKELADTTVKLEKKKKRTKKHAALVDEIYSEIAELTFAPLDWAPIIAGLQAAEQATRTTLAIKHLDNVISLLRTEADDEEVILLLF